MYKKIALIYLSIGIITKPICVDPIPGENLWRLSMRIGVCLDIFSEETLSRLDILQSTTDDTNNDLHSIGEALSSQIEAIDLINDAVLVSISDNLVSIIESTSSVTDELIISVSDALSSQIEAIDLINDAILVSISDNLVSIIESTSSTTDELIISVSDSLTSKIMAIDAGNDALLLSVSDSLVSVIESTSSTTNELVTSVSDSLSSQIEAIDLINDAVLTSISDNLVSIIESTSSTTDELIISVSDSLTSKIMAIDAGNDALLLSVSDSLVSVIESTSSTTNELVTSVSDSLSSQIEAIDLINDAVLTSISDNLVSIIESTSSTTNELVTSVSDSLSSQIEAIDLINDAVLVSISDNLVSIIESTSATTNELIVSTNDSLTQNLFSVSDTLSSQIDALDAGNDALLLSVSDALTQDIQQVDTDLLSISDLLCSKIMAIDAGNDALILSVNDALVSIIETTSSEINSLIISTSDSLTQTLLSVSDSLSNQVETIDGTVITINNTVNNIDQNLLSISDVLTDIIMDVCSTSCSDTALLSISDVLTQDIQNIDIDLLSISDVLSERLINLGECSALASFNTCCDAHRSDYISFNFNYGVLADQTTQTSSGTSFGTIETPGMITAGFSTTSPSPTVDSVTLTSNRAVPCSPGDEVYGICSALFSAPVNTTQLNVTRSYIGLFDASNGMAVGYNKVSSGSSDEFGLMYRNNSVTTFVPQASFNIDPLNGTGPSGFTINPQVLNVFRFSYIWYGSNIARYQVLGTDGEWITFHEISNINNQTDAAFSNQDLPMRLEINSLATGAFIVSKTISTSSWRAGVIQCGASNAGTRTFSFNNTIALLASAGEVYAFTIRNKTTFGGETNRVLVRLSHVGGGNGASTTVPTLLRYYKNASLTGAAFVDVNTNNSVVEVDTSATAFSGGNLLWYVGGNGLEFEYTPTGAIEFYLAPGESITVTGEQLASLAVTALYTTATWEELQ